jgi:predicted DCC family thiol-disulfide oxidoreductase YuxK
VEILDWLHEQPDEEEEEEHKPAAGDAAAVLPWGNTCETCRTWEDCLMQQHERQHMHLLQQQRMELQQLLDVHQQQMNSLMYTHAKERGNMHRCQTVLHREGEH